jgi:23S rRNA (adenine-N6)-dimethyltransferase
VDARRRQRAPRRRAGGWHFLKSSDLVRRLIAGAAVSKRDLVLDLGAGRGIITKELSQTGARVKAVELDPRLALLLEERFAPVANVEVIQGDIVTFDLPSEPFKVVANLPFSTTTAMLRRIMDPESRMETSRTIVQFGAALKRTRSRGNLMNALTGPWFSCAMGEKISRECFAPAPGVDCAVLEINRRIPSLLKLQDRIGYERSVTEAFKFAQLPITKSLSRLHGGKRVKDALKKLDLKGANALDLTTEDWTQLFRLLSR